MNQGSLPDTSKTHELQGADTGMNGTWSIARYKSTHELQGADTGMNGTWGIASSRH